MIGVETILGDIGKRAGELAVNQIIKESSRLSRVREDLEWIETEMGRLRAYLEDAEAIQVKTAVVSNFIKEISNLAYEVKHIIETYFPKLISSWSRWKWLLGFRHMRSARAFSKEVEGIKEKVKDITEARRLFAADASSSNLEVPTMPPRPITFPTADEPYVDGIDTIVKNLKEKVLNKDLHPVVSITGTAGLGKTTLARKVYNSVQHLFDCAAWICVTECPNQQKLLRDIAEQVGLKKDEMEQNLETNLFKLLSTKRYVIVIDDIWHTTAWDDLKTHLPSNLNSEKERRIILTSRYENVGLYVGGRKSLFQLQPLGLETGRKLFYKMVADDPQNISETQYSQQLKDIGEQILKRCGGVPLAIILAAGLLRGKTDCAWTGVLEDILGMGQGKDTWLAIFALSYKDLPLHLKSCFLYFGLFPEDYEIEAFDLINLWAAEGFIRGSAVREVEEAGDDYLNQLIARNLIQVNQIKLDGRVFSVQIHDILHSLCIQEANKINFFNIYTDAVNCHSTCKVHRVAIHGSDIAPYLSLNPQTSLIHAMLCFHRETQWEGRAATNLLRDSRFLRLLRIEAYAIPSSLLTEICNLRQLTYLKLRFGRGLAELPCAISNLESLVTLDLQENRDIENLPNVIWSMKQLRHILLPETCSTLKGRRNSSEQVEFSLTNLQTLSWLPGESLEQDWLNKLTSLRTLRVNDPILPGDRSNRSKDIIELLSDGEPRLQKLEELRLRSSKYSPQLKTGSLNLSGYENLCNLRLTGIGMTEFPQHDKLPPNLTILTLESTHIKKDPMENLKKLQKLKILRLMTRSYDGEELFCSGKRGDFPELEVFVISNLEQIERLIVEEEGMPKLKVFEIGIVSDYTPVPDILIPDRLRKIIVMLDQYNRPHLYQCIYI